MRNNCFLNCTSKSLFMKNLFLSILCLSFYFSAKAQCSMVEVPLSERSNNATLIVEGKVVSQNSFWNTNHTMIYTSNEIEVYKIFKGTVAGTTVNVITVGGTVGYDRVTTDVMLSLKINDVGVFTLAPPTHMHNLPAVSSLVPQYETYASAQGFVKYDMNSLTATDPFHTYSNIETDLYPSVTAPDRRSYVEVQPFNTHSAAHYGPNPTVQSISSFSPTTVTAGTGTTLIINGSGFGATQGSGTVGFKNADDGGATYITPLATQYLSWTNTQIKVQVPANAGTGTIQVTQGVTTTSASTLTVSYAHLNVDFDPGSGTEAYQTDHVDDNGSGGYTWQMNANVSGNASESAAFMRAFDSWRCTTGINWVIGSNTSINDAVSDGTNVICNDNAAPLSAGILGVCFSYWSGCASGPTIVWYVNELDIIFDDGSNISPLTWQYGPALPTSSQYDFESVCVHELGHGHQLGHVIASGQIMHYALSNGASNRTLSANDIAGGNFVQAKSVVANVCGPGAMTNHTCSSPPVADFVGTPTALCAGGTVAFTDNSTNTPTSWSWTFQGGTPSTSTSQNPTITYNTPGTYSVSLTATNASGSDIQSFTNYITVYQNPNLSASSQTNISCNGGSNGAATVGISGGTPAYVYNWTPGNPTGDGTVSVSNLTSGTWTCTVTDSHSCTDSQTFSITQPSAISFTANSHTNISCNGGSNGTATVNAASGGAGGFTYNWTPGNPTGDGTTSVAGLTAGTYTCTATDANGCSATATFNITQPSAISITMSETDETCAGNDGTATATPSGGTSPYTYAWAPNVQTSQTATALIGGTFTCTVTDANGCSNSNTVTVNTVSCGQPPSAAFSASPTTVCAGGTVSFTDLSSNAPTSWSWTFPGGTPSSSTAQNPTVTYNTPGSYDVTLVATNANGSGNVTFGNYITVNSNPTLSITSNPSNGIVCSGNQATLTASGASSYSWTGGITNGNSFTPSATTTYTVTGTGSNGCQSTATSTITVNICSSTTTTVPCGLTFTKKAATVSAANVTGAVSYRFSFYNSSTNALISTYTQASRTLTLSSVPGLYYNTTYKWTVAVNTGSGFGPESNQNCTITLAPAQTTVPCGYSYNSLSTNIPIPVPGGTSNYKFSFYNNSTGVLVAQQIQSSYYINFSTVAGLQYGNTYKWTVACEYPLSSGGFAYGPESNPNCTVTFNAPQTTVPCGHIFNKTTGYTTCPTVSGGIGYRFTFYSNSVQVAQRAQSSNYIYFNQVTGLQNNVNYTWTVEVLYNNGSGNVYGPASSSSCTISFSASAIANNPNNQQAREGEQNTDMTPQTTNSIKVFPNPATDKISIETDEEVLSVSVYSLSGELIRKEEKVYETSLGGLDAGTYMIVVETASGLKHTLVVKE
jgi:PKD repeat protein